MEFGKIGQNLCRDRYIMKTITECQCLECKHFIDDRKFTCKAFPKGIPDDLVFTRVEHTKPYPGDHGIQFEKKKNV